MGDKTGFKKYKRALPKKEAVSKRKKHFKEFYKEVDEDFQNTQSARCMDCGIPFCHSGCPLGNIIPDFNDAVHKNDWKLAHTILSSTNNFPEFTGRICPAPCESACVLGINNDPVAIEFIEKSIVEKAFENGWIQPNTSITRTNKKVAIVGSGPAGLAAADQLNKAGHQVTVYERDDRIGGLLRYGIPDFKMEKNVIDRRLAILKAEGIQFKTNCNVGVDVSAQDLEKQYDAVLLCGGSTIPRDLPIEGRQFNGVHFAMDYLKQNNKRVAGDKIDKDATIGVKDENVVVIGGGDTGSDCVGTSNRLGAKSITQIELLTKPLTNRTESDPWPLWPMTLRTSTSHEEGCERDWAIMTKRFISDDGENLSGLEVVSVEWKKDESTGKNTLTEIPNSQKLIPCTKAFLSIGFVHPQLEGMLKQLGIVLDNRNNVFTNNYQSSVSKVFAAGDMRRGQSLVVWAIAEGREAASAVDEFLMGGVSELDVKDRSVLCM